MKFSSHEEAYRVMFTIRTFEQNLLRLFSENRLKGTTHTSIGQEAVAVSSMNPVTDDDFVFSNHRCHGHFIAYSDNPETLLAEIMGKASGMCAGRGGSQHICYQHFFTNGVQGGIVPNAVGLALSKKIKDEDGIVVVFLGDGTLGQGVVYESFNIASSLQLPILFVIEDNGYAMSTPVSYDVAGSIVDRPKAFGIATNEITSNDFNELNPTFESAFSYVRNERKPYCQIVHTYRLGPHSKGDDYRNPDEIASWKLKDPLLYLEKSLDQNDVAQIQKDVTERVAAAEKTAEADSIAFLEKKEIGNDSFEFESIRSRSTSRVIEGINQSLRELLNHPNTLILGEDICDPYGGAFKATQGLSTDFPDKVLNMPISEAAMTGISVGLAMNGVFPVMELMFGDFVSLSFDQLLNHASKYRWMYNEQIQTPFVLRVPSGGGRGYGATHSQSLEKYLIGIPNIDTIAVSKLVDLPKLWQRIHSISIDPVIMIENKKMYGERQYDLSDGTVNHFHVEESTGCYPVYRLSLTKDSPDAVIITYGQNLDMAMQAAYELMLEDELDVQVICETSISPVDLQTTIQYIGNCPNIITLEEGTKELCWGSEVIAALSEHISGKTYCRVAAEDAVIPCSTELENQVLPSVIQLKEQIRRICH